MRSGTLLLPSSSPRSVLWSRRGEGPGGVPCLTPQVIWTQAQASLGPQGQTRCPHLTGFTDSRSRPSARTGQLWPRQRRGKLQ
jgi:hypothetical protein